jgi:hypothetical protein
VLDRLTDQAHIIETGSESYRRQYRTFTKALGKSIAERIRLHRAELNLSEKSFVTDRNWRLGLEETM